MLHTEFPAVIILLLLWLSKSFQCWDRFPLTGSYYHVSSAKLRYTEASCACREMGSHLAQIETTLELVFLDNILQKEFYNQSLWVGGSDLKKDGTFLWDDGTSVLQNLWTRGEPNNRNMENIIQIVQAHWHGDTNFTLNDAADHDAYFICEKPPGAIRMSRTWSVESRGMIHWDNVMVSVTGVSTLLECFLLCSKNCGCYSVEYASGIRVCHLYDAYKDRFQGTREKDGICAGFYTYVDITLECL